MGYSVRDFRATDAPALRHVTLTAIAHINARFYSPDQVAAWSSAHRDQARFVDRAEDGAIIIVAVDDQDKGIAFVLLEPTDEPAAHLDMLYCHPDHSRQGLAGRLLTHAEQTALQIGAQRLFTEASELAKPAFERAGYRIIRRRDFTITHDGHDVPIHNYAMDKRLR